MKKVVWVMVLLTMLTATAWAETGPGPEMIPTEMNYTFANLYFSDMVNSKTGQYGVQVMGEVTDNNPCPNKEGKEARKTTIFRITLYDAQGKVRGFTKFSTDTSIGQTAPFKVAIIPNVTVPEVKTYRIEQTSVI